MTKESEIFEAIYDRFEIDGDTPDGFVWLVCKDIETDEERKIIARPGLQSLMISQNIMKGDKLFIETFANRVTVCRARRS